MNSNGLHDGKYEMLFQPHRIGKMELKNRIVMLPIATRYATEDGFVTERMKNFYQARAEGGVGLIIIEVSYVHLHGRWMPNQLAVSQDKYIPGLSGLAQTIHRHGAKVALQLHYAGDSANHLGQYLQAVAPSAFGKGGVVRAGEPPRELSRSEIQDIVGYFARGARRAITAGYDGVDIHAAHNHILATFLSSYWNRRTDAYGGSLRNRARIVLEILAAVRKEVGPDYPVWVRINGEEEGVQGLTREEAREVARWLEEAGSDAISVSSTGYYPNLTFPLSFRSNRHWIYPPGHYIPLAEGIKKVVKVPVIAAGRITPQLGERVLREGKADLIGIARGFLTDPELPNKLASGKAGDIVPCIACNECCDFVVRLRKCTINAALGREEEYRIKPALKSKRVLIAGGGPAGMEAARVATLRGHDVTLYEKGLELGGQLLVAHMPSSRRGIQALTGYLKSQVRKLGIKVELGKDVTPELIAEVKPDAVIVATGVIPFLPEIPGVDRPNVVGAADVLSGRVETGDRVVVIGGELVGCNVAEFLAERGRKVTMTRRGQQMGLRVGVTWRELLLNKLVELGVTMQTGVKYEEITNGGLVITNREGKRQTIEADTIVLASGARANDRLFKQLEGNTTAELYLAGDALVPRRALHAVADGSAIARMI
ncbi:MAG: FAD-dependent oxidoreductase [Chloroflexi bacterium]|nr:FAD-dependent oxidoreductase [Chloroflexota bacterium]